MYPFLLVDNLGNGRMYPGHTIAGNEEAAGHEAVRAFDNRRSGADYWTPTTPNNDANLMITCDRIRAADMVVLDRGHNLAGVLVEVQVSQDNATWETVVTATLPAASSPASLDSVNGVRTEEGAWLKRFPVRAGTYWRLLIPAMGANLLPIVVGCWIGKSFAPVTHQDWLFQRPVGPGLDTLQGIEQASEAGWMGNGQLTQRRQGTLVLRLTNLFDFDLGRWNIEAQYGLRRPLWVGFDDSQPDRAFLAIRPLAEQTGFTSTAQYFFPQASIPYLEHEPSRT